MEPLEADILANPADTANVEETPVPADIGRRDPLPSNAMFRKSGSFANSSIVSDNKTPTGLSIKEAEDVIEQFKKRFPGASKLDFAVRQTQHDAFGPNSGIKDRVKGAYFGADGQVLLIADNLSNKSEAERVLQHEVLAHHGLNLFDKNTKRAILQKVADSRNEPSRRSVFKEVEADGYGKSDTLLVAEEVIAYIAEKTNVDGKLQKARDKIAAFIIQKLREIGFINGKVSIFEIRELVRSMGQGIRSGKAQQTLPMNNDSQFKKDDMNPTSSARGDTPAPIDRVIIGHTMGVMKQHKDYTAAKAGDIDAAVNLVSDLLSADVVKKVKDELGNSKPVLIPVHAIERTGENKIPVTVAAKLSKELGLDLGTDVIQSSRVGRTNLDGLDRLFIQPEFEGAIEANKDYFLEGDTLTRGGTFAALSSHITSNGGRVIGAFVLTGKQYSSKLALTDELLQQLRDKYGDIEERFRNSRGYGFSSLTQSEARYLINFKPPESIRERFAQEELKRVGEDRSKELLTQTNTSPDGDQAPPSEGPDHFRVDKNTKYKKSPAPDHTDANHAIDILNTTIDNGSRWKDNKEGIIKKLGLLSKTAVRNALALLSRRQLGGKPSVNPDTPDLRLSI